MSESPSQITLNQRDIYEQIGLQQSRSVKWSLTVYSWYMTTLNSLLYEAVMGQLGAIHISLELSANVASKDIAFVGLKVKDSNLNTFLDFTLINWRVNGIDKLSEFIWNKLTANRQVPGSNFPLTTRRRYLRCKTNSSVNILAQATYLLAESCKLNEICSL